MGLVPTGDIVREASRARRGACAFNVIQLEHAEAIVAGAESANAPVILQISENTVRYHGSLVPIGSTVLTVAQRSRVPVGVHLDHVTDRALVTEAVGLGFGSVMFDSGTSDHDDNVAAIAAVVKECHRAGVWVEAELGEVGGKDGVHAPGARTDPKDAAEFVSASGVDALAVAVGNAHAMLTRSAHLDLELIAELHDALPVPLALHGSSGVPEADLSAAIGKGMTKINISTHLNKAFTAAVRDVLTDDEALVDPRAYLGRGRDAVMREVAHLLQLLAQPLTR